MASPLQSEVRVDNLVTEDDEPVDNLFSAKQQRLLVEPLYSSWARGRTDFLADANVGVYGSVHAEPLVPDGFLSLDVQVPDDWWADNHRCYMCWEYGKAPDVVIEIVSNRKGGEDTRKLKDYARIGVPYYAIFDPQNLLSRKTLRLYELHPSAGYRQTRAVNIPRVKLGLTLWNGSFENKRATWLRWCDLDGLLIPTGGEQADSERSRADLERSRAESERSRAESEHERAESAHQRAERLAEKLRRAGIDPDTD